MKASEAVKWALIIPAAGWLCVWSCRAKEAEKPKHSTAVTDRDACQGQLNLIYGALQEYQKQNQALPRWLSDLHPNFIGAENLTCPYVIKSGQEKKWKEGFSSTVFGEGSSYAYEFCVRPVSHRPETTCRDYKQRQTEIIGMGVPIVRCWAHRPVLNMAFDGQVYETKSDHWEDLFGTSPVEQKYFHSVSRMTTNTLNGIVREVLPPSGETTDARFVDLSPHYNSLLSHLGQITPSGELLKLCPEGRQKIGEVEFEIRALVHLGARDFPLEFPEKTEAIQVNRRCRRVYFLHGTLNAAPQGTRIGSYFVHRSDGSKSEAAIIYGKDVKTRWFNPRQRSERGGPPPVLVRVEDGMHAGNKALRLYQRTWDNPTPDVEVREIHFVSHLTASAPFLVAITVE